MNIYLYLYACNITKNNTKYIHNTYVLFTTIHILNNNIIIYYYKEKTLFMSEKKEKKTKQKIKRKKRRMKRKEKINTIAITNK